MFLMSLLAACAPDVAPEETDSVAQPLGSWVAARHLVADIRFIYTAPVACTTVREMDGVEVFGIGELICPTCDVLFAGDTAITEASRACYDTINPVGGTPFRTEYWGWRPNDLARGSVPNIAMYNIEDFRAPAEGVEATFSFAQGYVDADGDHAYTIEGSVTWTNEASLLRPDPEARPLGPYTCGWPQNDPGDLDAPDAIEFGGIIPDMNMEDQCGETVALWDFYGTSTLFVAAQAECDACVYTALAANTFAEARTATGTDVRVAILFEGTDDEYAAAKITYGAIGPVLRNRSYSQLVSLRLFGYVPVGSQWWLVDPSLTFVQAGVGTLDFSELNEVL